MKPINPAEMLNPIRILIPIKTSIKIHVFCFFFLTTSVFNLSAMALNKPLATIHIKNTSAIERNDEIVEVKFSELLPKLNNKSFRIIDAVSGTEVLY